MYALNVTVKLLAILTKVVISLAFSEILPGASANTAKPTKISYKTDAKQGHFADSKDQ